MAEFTAGGEAPIWKDEGLDRGVGFWGLLWASETSIIGSGWLFGALGAAVIAGPSAILGWVLAGIIISVLALIHAELGGLFPVTGGTSRFPHYAFGSFAGATFGWASYLQAASVAPIEVLAAIQYLSTAHWARHWVNHSNMLEGWGILAAVVLTFAFVAFNIIGIRWLAKISNAITLWKIFIPVLTIVILIIGHFHGHNFHGFFVKGSGLKAILATLPAGLIFSLLGFEQAVQLAGEAANPQKHLAKAVIGSVVIGVILYILIQIAFIGAMDPAFLAAHGGWLNLTPSTIPASLQPLNSGPFWTVASMAGIGWLATVLRIDAVISPSGTALIYQTSSARLSFGMSKNGFVPELFESVGKTKVPVFGVIVAGVIGLLFLLPFPSWNKLVGVVTSASVLMYAAAPLALGAMRKQKPDLPRPYKVPAAEILAPAGFVGATWVIVFSGWQTYTTLIVAMLIGYLLIWISYATHSNSKAPAMDWVALPWIAAYFVGLLVIIYFGAFGGGAAIGGVGIFKHVLTQGGNDDLGLAGTLIISAAWSLACYYWAISKRLPVEEVDKYVEDVYPSEMLGH